MKIAVYIRILPEISAVTDGNYYSRPYEESELIIDPISRSVLEAAIALKEKLNASLLLFAAAPRSAAKELSRAAMCGADETILFAQESSPDILVEAKICADLLKEKNINYLLIPSCSDILCFTTIAPVVSSLSGIAYCERTVSLSVSESSVSAVFEGLRGSVKRRTLDARGIISYCGMDRLRYPELKNRLAFIDRPVEIREFDNIDNTVLRSFEKNERVAVEELSPQDAAGRIIEIIQEKGVLKI